MRTFIKIILSALVIVVIAGFIYPRFCGKSAPMSISMRNFYNLTHIQSFLSKYEETAFPKSLEELFENKSEIRERYFHDVVTNENQNWLFVGAGKKFSEMKEGEIIISSPVYRERNANYKIELLKRDGRIVVDTIKIE